MEKPTRGNLPTLAGLVALPFLAGALGSWATMSEVRGWYTTLAKPAFNPPSWVFGPVWTVLYILMGVSLWLVWRSPSPESCTTKVTWFAMLALNAAWSPLFFGMHRPDLALIDIAFYLVALSALTRLLWAQSHLAGWLQLPHLAWVTFAAVLNASIWWLNR
jgi:benzodiazapine receptor